MGGRGWDRLISHGYLPRIERGRASVGLLNANDFSYGIANLGFQTIAHYLQEHGVNVYFGFADTLTSNSPFINDPSMNPCDCDVIGISIPFEDRYLHALKMIADAGFSIHAEKRDDTDPLIVAGGMAMINPIPFSRFVDVVVIGEGREALNQIVARYSRARVRGVSKRDAVGDLIDIPGVYIPSNYNIEVDDDGYVASFECSAGPKQISSNVVLDPSSYPIYSEWTSSYACYEDDDYMSIMSAMGCHKKCPFCVVGYVQGAASGRAVAMDEDQILNLAVERRARYGTNLIKIFFSSAFSPGEGDIDSSALVSLLDRMRSHSFHCRVGSLNVRQATPDLFRVLRDVGQREVTFAPETAQDLRPRIGKGYITDDKLLRLASLARRSGMDMNIYSLGGIPGESERTIASYAGLLRGMHTELAPNRMRVHYNPVFMKAQTPFQYFPNTRPEEIRRRFDILRSHLDQTEIEYVSVIGDPMTYYQPVLALGDHQAGAVMELLYRRAGHVTERDWVRAFRLLGFDDSRYFTKKDPTKTLPWEHIAYSDHQRLKRIARGMG